MVTLFIKTGAMHEKSISGASYSFFKSPPSSYFVPRGGISLSGRPATKLAAFAFFGQVALFPGNRSSEKNFCEKLSKKNEDCFCFVCYYLDKQEFSFGIQTGSNFQTFG